MFRSLIPVAATLIAVPSAAQDSTEALRSAQAVGLKANSRIILQVSSAHANSDGTTTMVLKLWGTTRTLTEVAIPAHYAGWTCSSSDNATAAPATFETPNRHPVPSDKRGALTATAAGNDTFIVKFNEPVVIPVIASCRPSTDRKLSLNVAFLYDAGADFRWSTQKFTVSAFSVS